MDAEFGVKNEFGAQRRNLSGGEKGNINGNTVHSKTVAHLVTRGAQTIVFVVLILVPSSPRQLKGDGGRICLILL